MRQDGKLVVEVVDDGRGGADAGGSGLRGLADRLEAHGGSAHGGERRRRRDTRRRGDPVRVVIADDAVLLREGIARVLSENGYEVVAQVGDPVALTEAVDSLRPDLAIVDVRMPPTFTDEGTQAAIALRAEHPDLRILVLSQIVEARHALRLFRETPEGFGYLLKDRVVQLDDFLDAVHRVGRGGTAIDPEVVAQLLGRKPADDPLAELTPREREVPRAHRGRPLQQGALREALPQPEDDRDAREQHLPQARPPARARRPSPRARGARLPARLGVVMPPATPVERCGTPQRAFATVRR